MLSHDHSGTSASQLHYEGVLVPVLAPEMYDVVRPRGAHDAISPFTFRPQCSV